MSRNKRLRVFAGPNGSGKSTLFDEFKKKYNPGYFVNADELEKQLNVKGSINLQTIGIKANQNDLITFLRTKDAKSLLKKAVAEGHVIDIEITGTLLINNANKSHSYQAALIAAFIRWLLYRNKKSFSFETVMSHPSKLAEMNLAKKNGYNNYLYFVCTDDVEINVNRVANRVAKKGHSVNDSKIGSRYLNTLKNLFPAIKLAYRAYLFDNSGKTLKLIAEVFEGTLKLKKNSQPQWFIDYVLPHYKLKN